MKHIWGVCSAVACGAAGWEGLHHDPQMQTVLVLMAILFALWKLIEVQQEKVKP